MTCNFHVGQKVVCIDGAPRGGGGEEIFPTKGSVYTVREIVWSTGLRKFQIRLEELVNEPRFYAGYNLPFEAAFCPLRFRPVVERKTDISIFKAMLTPSKKRVEA